MLACSQSERYSRCGITDLLSEVSSEAPFIVCSKTVPLLWTASFENEHPLEYGSSLKASKLLFASKNNALQRAATHCKTSCNALRGNVKLGGGFSGSISTDTEILVSHNTMCLTFAASKVEHNGCVVWLVMQSIVLSSTLSSLHR